MWLVGRYGEQGVMLHVCSKAFQYRLFGMTSSEVGARRALGAVGGAWRDSATMCYSGPGAGRSGGVLLGSVALRALEVASYRRSQGRGQGAPRTCRCIETCYYSRETLHMGGQGAPRTCRCIETKNGILFYHRLKSQGAPRSCGCTESFCRGILGRPEIRGIFGPVVIGLRGAGSGGSAMGQGQRRGVAVASAVPGRAPSGSGVRCGAGRGDAAHSTGTRRQRIRGIMRKRLGVQRR